MKLQLKIGARGSRLSLLQAEQALVQLGGLLPGLEWTLVPFSSPGDQDQRTDLRESPPDFFTRDLDDALRRGDIDCALHSAKDMPYPAPAGLDWVWLPWTEDPRDALIFRRGCRADQLPPSPRIGVSSARREDFCLRRFPGGVLKGIRGTIDRRLEQLDAGDYDVLVMAVAALNRLGLQERISEFIPEGELVPPAGQGVIGMSFRADDRRFLDIRQLFVKSVTFAGAGIGSDAASLSVAAALGRCEVCLYDALLDEGLLRFLPAGTVLVPVGKRSGAHAVPQPEITRMICDYVRQGRRVVRLKGGDPGIFGRLAEEIEALEALELPFRVISGVSSLAVATTGTGMLLTRRGESRGFTVMTPRREGGSLGSSGRDERARLPMVFYMAITSATEVFAELQQEGLPPATPAAAVFNAGMPDEQILRGTLADLPAQIKAWLAALTDEAPPGLLIVGSPAATVYRRDLGALSGRRVLITCSEALLEEASGLVRDFGGIPICRPLIRLEPIADGTDWAGVLARTNWLVISSPSSARCFMEILFRDGVDLRRLPKILSCGPGTTKALAKYGIQADAEPLEAYGSDGIVACAKTEMTIGDRVLRLRSEKAGDALAKRLETLGLLVSERLVYENRRNDPGKLPESDIIFFASASAVEAAVEAWGAEEIRKRMLVVIGKPTAAALANVSLPADVIAAEATVKGAIASLASHSVGKKLPH
jgi:uroporphyrinogen III methyltransferase/synthase